MRRLRFLNVNRIMLLFSKLAIGFPSIYAIRLLLTRVSDSTGRGSPRWPQASASDLHTTEVRALRLLDRIQTHRLFLYSPPSEYGSPSLKDSKNSIIRDLRKACEMPSLVFINKDLLEEGPGYSVYALAVWALQQQVIGGDSDCKSRQA